MFGIYIMPSVILTTAIIFESVANVAITYGGVEGPPHIVFDIMLSHTDDIVTRP